MTSTRIVHCKKEPFDVYIGRPSKEEERKNMKIPWESIKVKDGVQMSGAEIANDIYEQTGIKTTRQNISNALKRAMKKFFLRLSREESELRPFEVATKMFDMICRNDKKIRKNVDMFFRLFPKEIRRTIENDIKNYQEEIWMK